MSCTATTDPAEEPAAGDAHAALASPTRRRLLELLRATGAPRDAHDLAVATGLHPTTVRSHLEVLRRAGLLTAQPHRKPGPGRPRTAYTPTTGTESNNHPYEDLARLLAANLDDTAARRSARAEQAGWAWAAQLAPPAPTAPCASLDQAARAITGLFTELGFDPVLTAAGDDRHIALRACPFRAVAQEHPEVVCATHLGLLRGTLDRLGATTTSIQLRPFVEPDRCVAHLASPAGKAVPRHAPPRVIDELGCPP